jgi:hypothetical protein
VTSPTDVDIGADFLGYRIDELIGRGGMGIVYRAYDLRLKRTVALKLVTPELALDERFRERFARETELAISLEHPNVVPIHDAGDAAGRLYLAMRFVPGTDLRQLLQAEGALEPSRALAICGQVANALDAAHAKGLVHRDVKPSNVLLDTSEHVYLADFGLTRRLEEQGVQAGGGRSVGTPAYLAPEQIEGKQVDDRADIYSLGCLLVECLSGQPPYLHDSRLAVAWAHLQEEPPSVSRRNSQLPEAIDAVVGKALAKDPGDRYPTCAALIAAAEDALELRRPPILRRLRPLPLAAAALVASLVIALPAAGNVAVKKQRVEITSRDGVYGFVLTPMEVGPLERDSGQVSWGGVVESAVTRDRDQVDVNDVDATFLGKRGNLVVHMRNEWVNAGNGNFVNNGTWRIIGGTGAYAALMGSGRSAGPWPPVSFRMVGSVIVK